ncbi:MAG: 2OG-Fe(II) oxygenase [Caulobacteraceae bacterium]|nr:2OG-Fe(II) oxygenase [Caulobacteraceae bacterium]
MINLARLAAAPVESAPFAHFTVSDLIDPAALADVAEDFPAIDQPGLFPLSDLSYGPAFRRLVADLRRREFAILMERKLGVDLVDRPMMITVRGFCARRDGRSHTDSHDKIATGLIYLNEAGWDEPGGRLRLLRSGDVDDVITEVPPLGGTLVAFRRTDNSWHGHKPFEGRRRYLMFNWLRSDAALAKNVGRHKLSAVVKRLDPFHAR